MRSSSALSAFVLYSACVLASAVPRDSDTNLAATCQQLQAQLSKASAVFQPGSSGYTSGVEHYFLSSVDASACSVEPGTAQDIGKILQIVGKNRVPFGVKSGGHSGNPEFSASTGVQISLARFNQVVYHPGNGTVDIGAGQVWDAVYAQLDPQNVTVAGGRISGIGVAGYALGGGLSYYTNQYGFAVDTIVSVQVVLPSGQLVVASNNSYPDLFFALKGAYNNFGIVTQITFRSIPLGQVWGGLKIVSGDYLDTVTNLTIKYIEEVSDPKAQLITMYIGGGATGQSSVAVQTFYDGPTPPAGIFDDLMAVPSISDDTGTRSLLSIVQSAGGAGSSGTRGYFDTSSIPKVTAPLVKAIVNETTFWSSRLANTSNTEVAYAVEIFRDDVFSHASQGSSAYPPDRSVTNFPLALTFAWTSASDDQLIGDAMAQSSHYLASLASAEGQDTSNTAVYGNYASSHSWTSERIFGQNLPRLQALKKQYDPQNVMGLTGGWKVTV